MENSSEDDIEDLVDNFIIRKPRDQQTSFVAARKDTVRGLKIHHHIPLLIGDILRSSFDPEHKVFTLNNPATCCFRSCLLYGFVVGQGVHNKSYYKFIIDDGTGTMEISIFNKPEETKAIKSLYDEVNALVAIPGSEIHKPVSNRMVRLLDKALKYIDASVILPGTNIMLCGRPNYFRNKIGIDVTSFMVDSEKSRKLEIAFADNLIDYYQKHINT